MSEPVDNGEPAPRHHEPALEAAQEPLSVLPAETDFPPSVLPVEQIDPVAAWMKGGHPFIAWIMIGLLVLGVPFLREQRTGGEPAAQASHLSLLVFTMQAKLLVGMHNFLQSGGQANDASMLQQAEQLNVGSLDQRLCYIALVGELGGYQLARQKLAELKTKLTQGPAVHSEQALRAMETMERLYADYQEGLFNAPSVGPEDRENLRQTLGWLGELALTPRGGGDDSARQKLLASADNIVIVIIPLFVLGALVGLAGCIGLIVLCVYILFGKSNHSSVISRSDSGGIYAETFALWMFAFLILSFAPLVIRIHGAELLVTAFATLTSLFVLVWPVVRGISWRQVRQDIGLIGGRNLLVEPLMGPVGYAISLPLLCIGAIVMLLLMRLQGLFPGADAALLPLADEFNPVGFPTHPIVEILARPGWNGKLQVLFLGTVIAPIIEEIMFRGVLYRHMRDATGRWPLWTSVITSALVVSFVFAVIHPQGLVAVPALMGLAMGFTLMRQWRGSLISCMVAHGINNGIVMLLAAFIFST